LLCCNGTTSEAAIRLYSVAGAGLDVVHTAVEAAAAVGGLDFLSGLAQAHAGGCGKWQRSLASQTNSNSLSIASRRWGVEGILMPTSKIILIRQNDDM